MVDDADVRFRCDERDALLVRFGTSKASVMVFSVRGLSGPGLLLCQGCRVLVGRCRFL